jgi:ABC-type lipoprotein release transport system permease subunit
MLLERRRWRARTDPSPASSCCRARSTSSVLIGVYPTDAISLAAAETVLLLVGLAATLAPALRAVRANPFDIIRAV